MDNQFDDLAEQYSSKKSDYYHNQRSEMLRFVATDAKRVLDIGCSTGGFGAGLKRTRPDIEVWGIEPYEDAAKEAAKVLDKVLCTTLSNTTEGLEGEKFDLIVFNDVLEHLVKPGLALKNCKQYLNEGGMVLTSIPNILYFPVFVKQIIVREDWKYTDEGTLDNTHLRFFTRKSIQRLFEDNGYAISQIEGINAYSSLYFKIANSITLGKISDWRYLQFATIAKPKV